MWFVARRWNEAQRGVGEIVKAWNSAFFVVDGLLNECVCKGFAGKLC